jgi:type III pantothenate kinase
MNNEWSLCIDLGNTRAKCAVYHEDALVIYHRSTDLDVGLLKDWKKEYNLNTAIISSTRDLENEVLDHLSSLFSLIVLDHHTPIPISNLYETPETLGKDRLAAAVGSAALFPNENIIFIDAGTCLTYNFIDHQGQYHGGNISPGVYMRLEAMHRFTDKLPLVEIVYHEDLLGKNTVKAMQNGAVRAAIYEITAFIDRISKKYGDCKVVITGGDAKLFAKHLNFKIFAHPNLVLFGLNKILMFNLSHGRKPSTTNEQ